MATKNGAPETPEEAERFFEERMAGDDDVYHWTADGQPANQFTRDLQKRDPALYFRLRPPLKVQIGTERMSEIVRDVGLGVTPKGYTDEELLFHERVQEEAAFAAENGLALDWKGDLSFE